MAMVWAPLLPAEAQLFSRESWGGATLGGIIGGVIGHNSGRKTAEGIAIGAGAGLILGALSRPSYPDYYYPPTVVPYSTGPVYFHATVRPNYAITGAALGGLAGGIIGHNSGRQTAEGVAIGAGSGLILGALAEQRAGPRVQYVQSAPASVVAGAPAAQNAPSASAPTVEPPPAPPAPVINTVASGPPSSMAGANSLFGR